MRQTCRLAAAAALLCCGNALAADAPAAGALPDRQQAGTLEGVSLARSYGFGAGAHRLDAATELYGWRLGGSWYVGQREQRGAEDGLSLIWQGDRDQVSFSLDGVRFVRRF
tara:strand:+ start:3056 stop:3388 length:333 start_codon:yes stop_codon:yes gene_type:complete